MENKIIVCPFIGCLSILATWQLVSSKGSGQRERGREHPRQKLHPL